MISVLLGTSSVAQFFTVLLLFLFIVVLAYFSARWMGKMQGGMMTSNKNIQVLETMRLSNTKYIQILRVGKKYVAIAVAKDTVTMLAELEEDDIDFPNTGETVPMESFKEILKKLKNKNTDGQ